VNDDIVNLREKIERITLEIFSLFRERTNLVQKMARVKAKKGLTVENIKVEEELKRKILDIYAVNRMDKIFCINLFDLLLDESKRIQREWFESNIQGEIKK
jgi:chorismate mutase